MKGGGSPSGPQAGHSLKPRTGSRPGALFDLVVIVDWSALNVPSPQKPSKDAIWWAVAEKGEVAAPVYARTRSEALAKLEDQIETARAFGKRVLIGFDFPFGYPAGVAKHLTGQSSALALWDWIADALIDDESNLNNRFEVASKINRAFDGVGPFWGRPESWDYPDIPIGGKARFGSHPPERRLVERAIPKAKTVWQLMYVGSVGSQVLVGLPGVKRLRDRFGDCSAIWPFETGLATPEAQIVFAEIYPSLLSDLVKELARPEEILDAAQVRVVAGAYHALDLSGDLAELFGPPPQMTAADCELVAREEAWILGAGFEDTLMDAARIGVAA